MICDQLGNSPVRAGGRHRTLPRHPSEGMIPMTIIGLAAVLSAAGACIVLLWFVRRTTVIAGTERTLAIRLADHGELSVRVRVGAPIPEGQWRQFRVDASRLAAGLQPHAARFGTLEVHALGPLIAVRNGERVTGWGGPKAGNRQAVAIFAFLLDRGERGAGRDEIVELIWPEVELGSADLAFHRTIGGLRRMLAGTSGSGGKQAIAYRDGVYRLDLRLVRWTDIDDFDRHVRAIETGGDLDSLEASLEAVRGLYRGDYMDDCPIYGDSAHVEIRRQLLRDQYVGALRTVAEAREEAGRAAAAAHLLREAWAVAGGPRLEQLPVARAVKSVA